jgi:hypothetical protein
MADYEHLPPDFNQRCDTYRAALDCANFYGNPDDEERALLEQERQRIRLTMDDVTSIELEYLQANAARIIGRLHTLLRTSRDQHARLQAKIEVIESSQAQVWARVENLEDWVGVDPEHPAFTHQLDTMQQNRELERQAREAARLSREVWEAKQEYASLIIVDPGETGLPEGYKFRLSQLNRLGRSQTCHIRLNDSSLAGRHALLWADETWKLNAYLGTHNVTQLNGRSVDRPTPLNYGDIVTVGNVELHLARQVQLAHPG